MERQPARCLTLALLLVGVPALASAQPAVGVYQQHCASCHGADRLGGSGPALLPENLGRLRRQEAGKVIADGRFATQMQAFGDKLTSGEIQGLVDFIYAPLPQLPEWGLEQIRASRVEHVKPGTLGDKPVFGADPLNLFVVVEAGDHHATILDGDRFVPLARFATRFALHGGPKFSPDGRYVYFASRDGWIGKYDLYNLKTVAETRAGINTRNAAVSGDGRFVMVANYLPHTLVVLDARDLSPVRVLKVQDKNGRSSRVSAVYDAAPRRSFVAALKDIPEIWEVSYDENAPPLHEGPVHDYRMGEAIAASGFL
ncbi:MAG: nitrite reductase, partial [Burkholderiales bacterium]|nr:nitrite reductase [Burkholderiales bacterium]